MPATAAPKVASTAMLTVVTAEPSDCRESACPLPGFESPLSTLGAGARCRVSRVDGADAVRMKALGICEGRVLEVLRTGDAWVLRVLGSRVGLSSRLAPSVMVTPA